MGTAELDALTRRVRHDLEAIEVPPRDWLPAVARPCGASASDVVVVGAGLSGLSIAFGLMRKGVRRIRVIDAAPEGREGPWITTARMRTLRSPKWLSGPDWGVPSLTYRAWHEALYGASHYETLTLIPKEDWMAYLVWFRRALGLEVENNTSLLGIEDDGAHLELSLRGPQGEETAYCRRVVLATGITGAGAPIVPESVTALPQDRCNHSDAPFDCARFAGEDVAILGAAASAFDFAVAALENGVRKVTVIARGREMPVTEILDWSNFPGFLEHFADLSDEWRVRFTDRMLAFRAPPTQEMYDRATGDPRFSMLAGVDIERAAPTVDGIALTLSDGMQLAAHRLLLGTGYAVDLASRPELAPFAADVALWRDRFTPPDDLKRSAVLDYPYLGPAFELTEREPGTAPILSRIHLFNNGAVPSLGPICNGVTGLKFGAPRIVSGLTRALFMEDVESHYGALDAFDRRHFDPRRVPESA
ncbi:MAG: NAD(P)/FAD-dependent oxidoreductase [Pseudomonadota bacterium]